ncbi:MAG: trimethylamine methyltransferase family protein, partial [Kiritimatiellae bacterium]|nr:trimethylamine methyltransferase family protein [Kiritimatiellia bacterium]
MKTIEPIRFLSHSEMLRIHEAAKRILSEVGMRIHSHRALDFLAARGCRVNHDSFLVRFPEEVIENCVSHMRRQFADPNRLPSRMSVRYAHIRFTSEELRVHPDFSLSTG